MARMKNVLRLTIPIICSSILMGCASTTQYVQLPDQSKPIEDPSKARIYVVRPTSFGAAVSMDVRDGDKIIGKTGANGYLCWEREAGQTEVVGKAENTSSLPVTAQEGMVYYIEQRVELGVMRARNRLTLLSEDEGKKKVGKCKPPKVAKK